jgi:hypothetical protein
MPTGAWTLDPGATINLDAVGYLDPGEAWATSTPARRRLFL